MTKVFVGNFSFAVDEVRLREHFAKIGSVISAKVMTEGPGGRSRGFGFVEMSTPEEAQRAISDLDGTVWEGRVIKVSEDRSSRRHDDSRIGQGGHGGHDGEHGHSDSDGGRHVPTGYFRAQPLDLGIRKKRKLDPFIEDPTLRLDYKDPKMLSRFLSERGRVLPRRMTGLSAAHQRQIARAVRRAHHLALLPMSRG